MTDIGVMPALCGQDFIDMKWQKIYAVTMKTSFYQILTRKSIA
jgi:hypothetical protein